MNNNYNCKSKFKRSSLKYRQVTAGPGQTEGNIYSTSMQTEGKLIFILPVSCVLITIYSQQAK
jgi:hypothetical protein